ncbi:hypothetical protein VNI00_005388 [Paramarasmius palmivorus]|uniref:Uncharacterized protein n=1 Tax=Paramarasmius palmivorus TaxID=297713 RepID=A0AAW0DDH1_9AGAR
MHYKNILLTSVYLFSAASATPLAVRSPCNPNFEGAGIVFHGSNGVITANGMPSSASPAWHIQQNGQPDPSYIFKNIYNSTQALTLERFGFMWLDTASDSGNDPRQLFDIVCDTCVGGASSLPQGSTVAAGCRITAPAYLDQCVWVTGPSPTNGMRIWTCTGRPDQEFWFST